MEAITEKLIPVASFIKRYGVLMVIVGFGLVYGYLILLSGSLAQSEPSDQQVSENYKAADRPKIDQVIVEKLNELEDQNLQFQALIDEARRNPFSE
jgi:hypothetical protein